MKPLAEGIEQLWHPWTTMELCCLPHVGVRSKEAISCLFDPIRCLGLLHLITVFSFQMFLSGFVMATNKQTKSN